jgi:Flp pilus assembly protein TadD
MTQRSTSDMIRSELDRIFITLGLDPSEVTVPYELTDPMKAWVLAAVPRKLGRDQRLEVLIKTLLAPGEDAFKFQWGYTGTAAEIFETRKANCLAFTNLFIAMAREVGLPVYYLLVDNQETYRKDGDLIFISNHIVAGYGSLNSPKIIDFSETPAKAYRAIRLISDLEAIALFHSNRGAEALRNGEVSDALSWLRTASRLAPERAGIWRNMGVALRRSKDFLGAEQAYRHALELDPGSSSTLLNLAALLRRLDRMGEARELEQALASASSRNPFTYLALADLSQAHQRFDEAERFYRRALRFGEEHAECHAALGEMALRQDKLRLAKKMLRKARALEPKHWRTQRLTRRLEFRNQGQENP